MIARLWFLLNHDDLSVSRAFSIWRHEMLFRFLVFRGYEIRCYRVTHDDFVWRGNNGDVPCYETTKYLMDSKSKRVLGMYVRRCK